jgi:hypothetical protein
MYRTTYIYKYAYEYIDTLYRFADGDPMWTMSNVRQNVAGAFFVGVAAGALGIAAGTIMSPLLLSDVC